MGFCAFLEVPHGIVRILEVPYEILYIIGKSSWDFVNYSMSIMGFCAFSEDPRGI